MTSYYLTVTEYLEFGDIIYTVLRKPRLKLFEFKRDRDIVA